MTRDHSGGIPFVLRGFTRLVENAIIPVTTPKLKMDFADTA
jgi:hypothetical protein